MKRRLFLKLSVFAVLAARMSRSALASTLGESPAPAERVFYDERFPQARAISAQLGARASTIRVQSDVTALWTGSLKELSRRHSLSLQGVTTESFHFCLKRLLQSEARVETQIRRVSTDLYVWSIKTAPTKKTG